MLLSQMTAAYGASDPGLHRDRNEDAFLVDAERGLFAVADGLGGLPHGEIASQYAIERLRGAPDVELRDLTELFNRISRKVRREGLKLSGETGIGTTLILAQLQETTVTIAHVGDCAAFVFNGEHMGQVTRDQTLAQQMIESGEPTVPDYLNHILTQCMGQGGQITPEILSLHFGEGSRLILCSDGITKTLEVGEITEVLARAPDPKTLVESLIATANERGGPDNATAVAVFR